MEISSPGGLPPGLKPEEFGKKSVHRNRLMAEMFQRLGEVERVGAGVRKIRDALRAAGLKAPKFEFTTFFTITFWRPESRETAQAGTPLMADAVDHVLASQLRQKIMGLCSEPKGSSELVTAMGHRRRYGAFDEAMATLLKRGLIRYTIPDRPRSRLQKYVITQFGRTVLESVGRRTRAGQGPAAESQ